MSDNAGKIMKLIEELDALAQKSPSMAFLGKLIIPEEPMLRIVDQLRQMVPAELKDARTIREKSRQILSRAQSESQSVRQKAQEQARAMAREQEIVKLAGIEAKQIVSRARIEAREIVDGANQYADELLRELEGMLDANLETVRNGLRVLRERAGDKARA